VHTHSRSFYAERLHRVSKSRTRQYAERAICTASPGWAGAFAAKRIRFGSGNCACQCVYSPRGDSPKRSLHLRRIRRLWLNFWGGLNRNPTPGVGRHVLNSSTTAACRICRCFWAFQNQSTITSLSDPRGDHTFARALLLAGLELPCDAARLQPRSSTKRGERRGGITSGPVVAAGLLLVGDAPGAALPPTFVEVCRVRHGPLFS